MGIVMNMSSYEIEQNPVEEEYGDEVMFAGWNPAVALLHQQAVAESADRQAAMPADLATVDAESFLRKMYAYQR
ncbi:MAG: hypothetical protein HZC43_08785 [Nitrosomonadales bacterium]|nr:hypothetical protein [Nitrosomonadales bacterium]